MKFAILSIDAIPSIFPEAPSEAHLLQEDDQLVSELRQLGSHAERISWHAEKDWSRFDVAVVRCTWDYQLVWEEYLKKLRKISSAVRLVNPYSLIEWNVNKTYLRTLQELGSSVVPTEVLSDIRALSLEEIADRLKCHAFVLKPSIGAGAYHAGSFRQPFSSDQQTLFTQLKTRPTRFEFIAQPFQESVVSEGEWSFIFFGGEFQYAILKKPKTKDYRVQGIYGGTAALSVPQSSDLDSAQEALRYLPTQPTIARVDMVRLANGKLGVMEMELIEPLLFFEYFPQGPQRLAEVLLRECTP